jgi:O-antigen ligase
MLRASRVRFRPVAHQWPVVAGAGLIALGAGRLVAQSGSTLPLGLLALGALAGVAAMFMLGPERLFLGWLVLASLLGGSADFSSLGYALRWGLYLAPALLFIPLTLLHWRPRALRWYDLLPAAFAGYVFVVMLVTSDLLTTDTVGAGKAYFQIFVLPAVVYYFLAFGPGRSISATRICWVVLAGAALQALLTYVEWKTSWNLWEDSAWRRGAKTRPVSTFSNPGLLGMFLGVGVVVALAVIVWRGPRALRRLSVAVLVLGIPATALTLTRGPILATAVSGLGVLLISRRGRLPGLAAVAFTAISLVVLWPAITSTDVYQNRLTNKGNVQGRYLLQDWSLRLAAQKPITGWGYQSFDRVKNAADFSTQGLPPSYVLDATSHDSYLTVLVEYGSVGFLMYLLPFVMLLVAGVRAFRRSVEEQWVIGASLAAVAVFLFTGATLDYRFFSFALMLPWVFFALIRRIAVR